MDHRRSVRWGSRCRSITRGSCRSGLGRSVGAEEAAPKRRWPEVVLLALGVHDALANLGFDPDHIYMVRDAAGLHFGVEVRMPGSPRFMISLPPGAIPDFESVWTEAIDAWNVGGSMTDDDRDLIRVGFRKRYSVVSLLAALMRKGVVPPHWDLSKTPFARA